MNIARLYHTLKHLRFEQFYYRLYYKLKAPFYHYPAVPGKAIEAARTFPKIVFPSINGEGKYKPANKTFTFLNEPHSFRGSFDWNYATKGKLWTYNLNYFDWLEDDNLSVEERLATVKDFVRSNNTRDGIEPYPISMRGMNWIKFISRHGIKDDAVNECLYKHYHRLAAFPEYQLMANHLLENGFSLFFAAHYFDNDQFHALANKILNKELEEQILGDGAHYELSPMYHCIILHHLLDCIMLAEHSPRFKNERLLQKMRSKAGLMLGWLKAFIYSDGSYAMVGDATYNVAPATKALFEYAKNVDIATAEVQLKESGYRKFNTENFELVFDAGNIMPSYQPGHAHADTLSFCLQVNGKPFIADGGISTYERGERRMYERGTAAHNTIVIDEKNSSDAWAAFRTGRRAKADIVSESAMSITAAHNGYRKEGIIHQRAIACDNQKIIIEDTLGGYKGQDASLYLHFHPGLLIEQVSEDQLMAGNIRITISGGYSMGMHNYLYCEGYNRLAEAKCLQVHVREHVTVIIELR